tara:strand:- start:4503 stop:4823 length:321 start_codon:yes stop_codon:yes gene_type:complete
MNIDKLKKLKNEIDNLDKIHHLKIFKILKDNGIKYSENRNGIFINMNSFDEKTIKEVEKTLNYINEQEKQLKDIESIKAHLQNDFFIKGKEVKDTNTNSIIANEYS